MRTITAFLKVTFKFSSEGVNSAVVKAAPFMEKLLLSGGKWNYEKLLQQKRHLSLPLPLNLTGHRSLGVSNFLLCNLPI
jgi:hypothetical protein